MTQHHLKAIQDGLKALDARFQDSSIVPNPVCTTPEALTKFLEKTDDVELSRSNRLIAFAHNFSGNLSWAQVCEVYERILVEDEPSEYGGTFATWTSLAESFISDPTRSSQERELIAQSLVSIINRALEEYPDNSAYALCLGMHYFREAVRGEINVDLIQQSRLWLQRVIEWADEDDQQVCTLSLLFQAHCCVALEEWQRALMLYNAVQPEWLGDEEAVVARETGILQCKKALGE